MTPPCASLLRAAALAAFLVVALGPAGAAEPTKPAAARPATGPVHINNLSYDRRRHSLILDITGPLTISTRSLKNPSRLVVDIPGADLTSHNRELIVKDALVQRVRIAQWKIFPPMVRVVIETSTPAEPLIAVQQTRDKLYVTLAPARGGEDLTEPTAKPTAGAYVTPAPEQSSAYTTPPPEETPAFATPLPATPKPATPRPATPRPATPRPVAKKTPRPHVGFQTPLPLPEPSVAPPPRPKPKARPPAKAKAHPASPSPKSLEPIWPITRTRLQPKHPLPSLKPVFPSATPVVPAPSPSLLPSPQPILPSPEATAPTLELPSEEPTMPGPSADLFPPPSAPPERESLPDVP